MTTSWARSASISHREPVGYDGWHDSVGPSRQPGRGGSEGRSSEQALSGGAAGSDELG